jgi:hypothetical protein
MLKHSTKVGVLVGPPLNLSGSQSRGARCRDYSNKDLADGAEHVRHSVGQLRDATRLGCNLLR